MDYGELTLIERHDALRQVIANLQDVILSQTEEIAKLQGECDRAEARVAELDHTLLLTLKRARDWERRARELESLCADRL